MTAPAQLHVTAWVPFGAEVRQADGLFILGNTRQGVCVDWKHMPGAATYVSISEWLKVFWR